MKFNLKNRPTPIGVLTEFERENEVWFVGFEKELRSLLEDERRLWKHDESTTIRVLKEILGE